MSSDYIYVNHVQNDPLDLDEWVENLRSMYWALWFESEELKESYDDPTSLLDAVDTVLKKSQGKLGAMNNKSIVHFRGFGEGSSEAAKFVLATESLIVANEEFSIHCLHSNDPRLAEIGYWVHDDVHLLSRLSKLPSPRFNTAGFEEANMVITEGDQDTIISRSALGFGPEDKFSYLSTSYKVENSRKVKEAQKALEEIWLNELLKLGVSPHSYRTEYKGAEL